MILIISLIVWVFIVTVFYITGFMIIRLNAGGFHANKHWSCMLILFSVYMTCLVAIKMIPANYYSIISAMLLLISIVTILILVPVEN